MLEKNENAPYDEKKKSIDYFLGKLFCFLIIACASSIIIAMTIKIVMWILGL